MPKLGVNVDHVATLRQARREGHPDPIQAAKISLRAGADSIVCHLREDRRHIQDADVRALRKAVQSPLNLEMALHPQIIDIACQIGPDYAMLVPERRQEITTEGGLDVIRNFTKIRKAALKLSKAGIRLSIFVDPEEKHIRKAKDAGAVIVELHTGPYANAKSAAGRKEQLKKLKAGAKLAAGLGLIVHAGHGLNYNNVRAVARIKQIDELNIGHAIISHAVFIGLKHAVKEMKRLVTV